jgi:predicted Zn-dependent protease with MMP-like domain
LVSSLEQTSDNAPFTAEQQAEIASRIDEVKALVRETFELEVGQLEGIDQKLEEIKEASTRVGRKDWRIMLYGAAFGMILTDAIQPGVVQSILEMVVHGVAHIFGLGAPPPGIPA